MSYHLGLSIGESMAEIVEFVREGPAITVTAIGEWPVNADLTDQTLGEHLGAFAQANNLKARTLSIALNTSRMIVNTFPADAGTTHPQWTSAARWELNRLLKGSGADAYLTDAIALPPPPGKSGVEVLSVSIRRADVAMFGHAAAASGMTVGSIDADLFCAETIYLERTPGGPPPASLLVMVRPDRIDWTRLFGRVTVRYGTSPLLNGGNVEEAIASLFPSIGTVDRIMLHGPKAQPEVAEALRNRLAVAAECLNPFATMAVPDALPLIEHFMRTPHRFAAAAGAALRAGDDL
jgi:Tfp pilus assembly PilM family ATPase